MVTYIYCLHFVDAGWCNCITFNFVFYYGPCTVSEIKLFIIIIIINKIAIQGTPQMAVDQEARAYRESTHVILSVPCPYTKWNLP